MALSLHVSADKYEENPIVCLSRLTVISVAGMREHDRILGLKNVRKIDCRLGKIPSQNGFRCRRYGLG